MVTPARRKDRNYRIVEGRKQWTCLVCDKPLVGTMYDTCGDCRKAGKGTARDNARTARRRVAPEDSAIVKRLEAREEERRAVLYGEKHAALANWYRDGCAVCGAHAGESLYGDYDTQIEELYGWLTGEAEPDFTAQLPWQMKPTYFAVICEDHENAPNVAMAGFYADGVVALCEEHYLEVLGNPEGELRAQFAQKREGTPEMRRARKMHTATLEELMRPFS